ncbi:MAG: SH3 domain-containing protein, partial [Microcoleaceae cyanobacterium]
MSFTPKQILITGASGLLTAVLVSYLTMQSRSRLNNETSSNNDSNNLPALTLETPNRRSPTPKSGEKSQPLLGNSQNSQNTAIVITAPTINCAIRMALVADPQPPLNVRSLPDSNNSQVVGTLANNTLVSVVEEKAGWLRITEPMVGWIAANRTRSSCANLDLDINAKPQPLKLLIKGEIIGTGSHVYRLQGKAGQMLTVQRNQSIFPVIITPSSKVLAG